MFTGLSCFFKFIACKLHFWGSSFQPNVVLLPMCLSAAPVRHMAFGVPGGSSNMAYIVLCGGGVTAAVVYVSICSSDLHCDQVATFLESDKRSKGWTAF